MIDRKNREGHKTMGILKTAFRQAAVMLHNRLNPVSVPLQDFNAVFRPDSPLYVRNPSIHQVILINLREASPGPRGGAVRSRSARWFLSDPGRTVLVKGHISEYADGEDEEDYELPSSSAVMYTEDARWGKKNVAVLIRRDAAGYGDLGEDSIIFGLFGTCEKDGTLTVRTILLPRDAGDGKLKGTYSVPLSPESVKRALDYAALCTGQLFGYRKLTPGHNLKQAGIAPRSPGGPAAAP